jgi:hypothetical protein
MATAGRDKLQAVEGRGLHPLDPETGRICTANRRMLRGAFRPFVPPTETTDAVLAKDSHSLQLGGAVLPPSRDLRAPPFPRLRGRERHWRC